MLNVKLMLGPLYDKVIAVSLARENVNKKVLI